MIGKVIDLTTDGRGVIKEDGKVIFLPGCLPDDEVEYVITKEKKNYMEGVVKNITSFSKYRIFEGENPLGGAYPLYALIYNYGMTIKVNKVKANFKKFLGIEPLFQSVLTKDMRVNKLRLHKDGGKIGLYKPRTNVVYEPDFDILMEDGNKIIEDLKKNLDGGKNITIRKGDNGLFLDTDGVYNGKLFKGVNDKSGESKEKPYMEILGNKYYVNIGGFFQNNKKGAENALKIIGDEKRKRVLDLYSGVGFISIYVAKDAKKVTGIEISESAVKNAKINADINNVFNAEFFAMDTAEFVKKGIGEFETVIVDPPRSGLVPSVIDKIISIRPNEFIYMSCDHVTQIRDLKSILPFYEIREAWIVDMFPGTMEVEVLLIMDRK